MDSEEFKKLVARTSEGLRIRRYTKRFLNYLFAADLSVSLAGYNTCMNLLVAQVPALVHPYSRQREQPMRVNKIKNLLPMKILGEEDLQPVPLSKHIVQLLHQPRSSAPPAVNLLGADNAASLLNRWADDSIN